MGLIYKEVSVYVRSQTNLDFGVQIPEYVAISVLFTSNQQLKRISPVATIALTEVFEGTVPSKILFPFPRNSYLKQMVQVSLFTFELRILRKRKYNS